MRNPEVIGYRSDCDRFVAGFTFSETNRKTQIAECLR